MTDETGLAAVPGGDEYEAEYVRRVVATGHHLDVLCDCGVPEGESEATDPRDRSIRLPHHFDCAAVEAWSAVTAALDARLADPATVEAIGRGVLLHTALDHDSPLIRCLCGYRNLTTTEHAAHVATAALAVVRGLLGGTGGAG